MQPGDIIRLRGWLGENVRLVPELDDKPLDNVIEHPPGTLALLLDVLNGHKDDGPGMDTYMRVLVGGKTGYVWAYECEEIK